jgi:predicted RNA binding protein YcfA (HicA-like mRNA interferase family)
MTKVSAAESRQIVRFPEQNGFVLDHTSGSHFIFYHPVSRRQAVVPSHNRDLPKGTLMPLLRESGFAGERSDQLSVHQVRAAIYVDKPPLTAAGIIASIPKVYFY